MMISSAIVYKNKISDLFKSSLGLGLVGDELTGGC